MPEREPTQSVLYSESRHNQKAFFVYHQSGPATCLMMRFHYMHMSHVRITDRGHHHTGDGL